MTKSYEAMFLLEPSMASDWTGAEAEVRRILDRAGANLLGMKNWDERKLAYSIGPHKRGLYALTYFEAAPDKIGGIERDVDLSEKVLRVLVLRRDGLTPQAMEKALTAAPPPKTSLRGPGGDDWGGGGRRFGGDGGYGGGRAAEAEGPVAVADEPDKDAPEQQREAPE